MNALMISLGFFAAGALGAALFYQRPAWASRAGVFGAVLGSAVGLTSAILKLIQNRHEGLMIADVFPYGKMVLGLDPLTAWFLVILYALTGLAALYGYAYLQHGDGARRAGKAWFFYNALAASMALVTLARNGLFFLMAWEVMSISSWFLVTLESDKETSRRAGLTYLIATHLGGAFLIAGFLMMERSTGSFVMNVLSASPMTPSQLNLLFVLFLIGFGSKAGFVPLHVWLPEAHPAAPSHVSALMSGVMIKMGIYGLLRFISLSGTPPSWWGWCLIGVGVTSGVVGVLFALAQNRLKTLLAYSSVENMGLLTIGLGLGVLGISLHRPGLAVLGLAGCLLHALNHAIFKGLLFLAAGAVLRQTGTDVLDRLGGLAKPMRVTSLAFLTGSAAICGLPPLNGFTSELFLYFAVFSVMMSRSSALSVWMIGVMVSLVLIGGLSALCFVKAFGLGFLGGSRDPGQTEVREVPALMRWPMLALALACLAGGLAAPWLAGALKSPVSFLSGLSAAEVKAQMGPVIRAFRSLLGLSGILILVAGALAWIRSKLLAGRAVTASVTWDCAYARPTARMQYTSDSFPGMILRSLRRCLGLHVKVQKPGGIFPSAASLTTTHRDVFRESIFEPLFQGTASLLMKWRWLQQGRVQLYVLYIALTLLFLFVFNLKD
ncbi:MAG: proton-conducting transporter membrane subunit [Candidatus Omnitrophota bacterium]|jgi:formate hydrogenlyase subunit 3/multisubunit Na+/H+ antiporter MnhD subunit